MSEIDAEPTATDAAPATENGDSDKPHPLADNEAFKQCLAAGLSADTATHLVKLIDAGHFAFSDLENRTIEPMKHMLPDHVAHVVDQFEQGNLIGVSNKASYLGLCIKSFRDRVRDVGLESAILVPVVRGPDSEKLQAILDRTGYPLEVSIGQRKYGPHPDRENEQPGAEIYVGRIPNDVFEDELIVLLESVGQIHDLRLMVDPATLLNKGYAFVTFVNKEDANQAALKFDDHEIRPGKRLKVNVSMANTRLFVGNIPKTKSKEEILEEFKSFADGLEDIIIYPSADNPEVKKNRGFCFAQFHDHKSASAVKRKLMSAKARPFGRDVIVDWAEAQGETDEEAQAKVKVVYVRGLKEETTEEQIKEVFDPKGTVEKVKKINNYAFVHFAEREEALKAIEELNNTEIDGNKVELSLAKPQMDRAKRDQLRRDRERRLGGYFRGRGGGGGFGYGGYGHAGFGGQEAFGGYGYGGGGYGGYDMYGGAGYADAYGYGYGGDPYGYGTDPYAYGGYDPYGGAAAGGYGYDYGYGGYGGGYGMRSRGGGYRGGGFRGGGGPRGGSGVGIKRKADDGARGEDKAKRMATDVKPASSQDFTSDNF